MHTTLSYVLTILCAVTVLAACQTNITTPSCSPFANASAGGGGAGGGGEAAEGGAGGQSSASAGADCTSGTVKQE